MLRSAALASVLVACPAWAGCPRKNFTSMPRIIDLPYLAARAVLKDAGFQPLLDWDRMQKGYDTPAEEWIDQAHYFEVQACSDNGRRMPRELC